jgi:excisionase family DNA binding protein
MTPEHRAALRLVADALPAGTSVPVLREHLLELLGGTPEAPAHVTQPADCTVAEVASRFGRDASTVRLWIRQGLLPGAYLFRRREWRIPAAAVAEYEARERTAGAEGRIPAVRGTIRKPTSLSAWRHRHDATTPQPALSAR